MQSPEIASVYQWLADVKDPEVPTLSILDLGIVRHVSIAGNNQVKVSITPTYSGCPAMDAIAVDIRLALTGRGFDGVQVDMQLSPAWTTDWMTEEGRRKLKAYGIAPPPRLSKKVGLALFEENTVPCPRCNSENTVLISNFGATSCKALYQCNDCKEPFEHFKCH